MNKRKQRTNKDEIVPGMEVWATQGDLGEQDVSHARVTDVEKNQDGKVEEIEITKGTVFRKKLKVPADRIQIDVASGAVAGQIVAYFIIISTSATLFIHNQSITSAADAARALQPLAGPLARYLFAIGLVGSGIVAIPVLLASTSYAVVGAIGWPSGLSKRPWQNEGFYLILTVSIIVGPGIALPGINPIKLIFWANIIAGVMAPFLVIAILLVGNNRTIMKNQRLSLLNNIGLVLIVIILAVAVFFLFSGLFRGQG